MAQEEEFELELRRSLLSQADTHAALNDARLLSSNETTAAAGVILKWASDDPSSVLEVIEAAAADAARSHDVHSLGLALASLEVGGGDGEACVSKRRGNGHLLHWCARNAGLRGGRIGAARATMRALIGWGADLQECDQSGKTPLQLALASQPPRSLELARTLLEEGANPEQPQADQETLLMKAAQDGDFASCELLLEFRADPLRRRQDGQTAITLASREDVPRQVLLALRSALTRDLAEESIGSDPSAAAGRVAGSRRSSAGAFSRMANHEDRPKKQVARSTPGAFSKLQSSDELTTPLSDQAKSLSFAESECETRLGDETDEAPSRTALFSMSDVDQEMYGSAEGLLNQVDLEEAYEDDWTVQTLPRRVSPRGDGERSQVGDCHPLEPKWSKLPHALEVVG